MNQAEMIGYVVLVVITLGSFIAVVQKFTQPINDLKVVIQELKDCIAQMRSDNEMQNRRITEHGKEIDELKSRIDKLETKVDMHHKEEK
jgi:peptidoglycan hydrolase CwlO-like protein